MPTKSGQRRTMARALAAWGAMASASCAPAPAGGDLPPPPATAELQSLRTRVAELEGLNRPGAATNPYKIVNFHDHVYRMKDAEKYVAAAPAAGIVKTVIVASPKYTIFGKGASKTEGYDENFQEILRVHRRWPDHFIPFSSLDPSAPDKLDTLRRHREQGAQGLKLYNGHSHFYVTEDQLGPEGLDEVLQFLVDERMPLLWHVRLSSYGKEFEEKVLKKYPNLKLVVAHYGVAFWRPNGPVMNDLPRLLDTYPNLHFDTSLGTRKILVDGMALMGQHKERFVRLMTRYPDRFVMGTDMVITGNPEKTVSWMGQVLRACRDQLEREEFTLPLAARWSKYKPKRGADADGRMPGLGLPASVLKQIYEITPAKLLGAPTAPATP